MRNCPQQFGLPEAKIRPFEKILMNYEAQLLSGVIFQVNFFAKLCIAMFTFKKLCRMNFLCVNEDSL